MWKVAWGSERDVTNAYLMYPRLWEVGVYSQPPHERWGLELRTSLFLSERAKLVTLGAHKDRRRFLRNETNSSFTALVCARGWLVDCADTCCVGGLITLWLQNIPEDVDLIKSFCSALQLLLEILRAGLGVEFLHSRSSTLSPPLPLSLLLSFRRGTPFIAPPILKEKKNP